MAKTQEAMGQFLLHLKTELRRTNFKICTYILVACVNELGEKAGKVPSPCDGRPSNLGYYMKESMDNYFRSGLKKVYLF
jgi:hypothetical protein